MCAPQRFRPITVERPKVLLPLVNTPLIEFTLEWLAMNRVEEVSGGGCAVRVLCAPARPILVWSTTAAC